MPVRIDFDNRQKHRLQSGRQTPSRSLGGSQREGSVSTGSTPPVSPRWRPSHNPWAVAMTVTLATFMEVLDTSIANVALPHIAGSLSAGQDESTWVLTSYLVSNAIVLPISAWMSDRFGRKRFYMTCVLLFTISSLFCGLSHHPAHAHLFPHPAGRRRRRTRSQRTGHPGRYLSAREAGAWALPCTAWP